MSRTRTKIDWNDYLQIGEIYREHGVKGFCKAYIYSGTDDNLHEGQEYILASENGGTLKTKLNEIRVAGRYFLLHFSAFGSPEDIISWRKAVIWIAKSNLCKERDEMYDYEWEGFEIVNEEGLAMGKILSVAYLPLKQFVVSTGTGGEFYVPYNPDWILSLDKAKKKVVMNLPEGILELS